MFISKEFKFATATSKKKRWFITLKCDKCGCIDTKVYCKGRDHDTCSSCMKGKATKDEFIAKASTLHAGKFDYTDSVYISNKKPITIRCIKHDLHFTVRVSDHLDAHSMGGCPMCKREYLKESYTTPAEVWAQEVRDKHTNITLIDTRPKIGYRDTAEFSCGTHGPFTRPVSAIRTPSFLCPKCKEDTFVQRQSIRMNLVGRNCVLYYVYLRDYNMYKLGCTVQPLEARLSGVAFDIIWEFSGEYTSILDLEYYLHTKFREDKQQLGALIKNGSTEIYHSNIIPNLKILQEIIGLRTSNGTPKAI